MRNYFKIRGLHWQATAPGPITANYYVFGADDEELMENQRIATAMHATDAGGPWSFSFPNAPVDIYFLLDESLFANILNVEAQTIWGVTNLPGGVAPGYPLFDNLRAQTRVGGVEDSPRKTWSHGH